MLTDLDASCRYCGHLLRGLDAGDPWSTTLEGGVRVESDAQDSLARPAAVVRRAGGDIRSTANADHHRQPGASDDFYDRSEVTRQHYSIEGQDEPRDLRRVVMLVVGVVLVVAIAVALFVHSRGDDTPASVTPQRVSWERVGPPGVPFTAELPGMATASSLRPFSEIETHAYESGPSVDQRYLVGAFDLPAGALAFGSDAYMKATAEKLAVLHNMVFVAGVGSDSTSGRVFDASVTSSAGWGLLHLLVRDTRLYYVAVFVQGSDDGARQTYVRVVQSFVPA